ncbi:MAG TPA: HAMP domain-containing sensor histidine kinase [Clostridia bacterium]|nr:HAMP domain-containing sensor histidine kinase [Clostridia bacterium]
MTKSIRFKIFITFVLLIVAFQAAFLIVNNYFLDDIYVSSTKSSMEKVYETYKLQVEEGIDIENAIMELSRDNGVTITVIQDGMVSATSSFEKRANQQFKIIPFIANNIRFLDERPEQDTFFTELRGLDSSRKSIIFIGRLKTGDYMVVEKPLALINQNTMIARRFIMISGLLTLILGSAAIFLVSGRITRPVVKMTKTAKAIAKQDFNEKVDYDGDDELGDLARSINHISDELDGALTGLRDANAKLTEDIERERKLEKMRRRFVSSVSHELKNPISMIQAYADGLRHNIAKNPKAMTEYAEIISDESDKMASLIKDLLDLSAYESGTFSINKTWFDFALMVQESSERQEKLFEEKGVKLETDLPSKAMLYGDALRMEQILSNFLANALRHSDVGGTVKVSLEDAKGRQRLCVHNTGSPIEEKELENIWTSFYKIRNSGLDPATGTGLGLAIVRAIVDLHGGTYGAENTDGGVAFWVEIPDSHIED